MARTVVEQGIPELLSTRVELKIMCRNLKNKDKLSKSDPVTIVFEKSVSTGKFVEIGRTEVIANSLNPDFVKRIPTSYRFEEQQLLRFEVYDSDCNTQTHEHRDFLGRIECSLGEIVSCRGKPFERKLVGECQHCGNITVAAEEVGTCKDILVLQFEATNLDKKDFLGKSDPYLMFLKNVGDGSWTLVHKTEVVMKTLNPEWKEFSIPVRSLCNGNIDEEILVKCYDWDKDGGHDYIGEFRTTARILMKGRSSENHYEVINIKKQTKKKSYKNSGICRVKSCRIDTEYSFLDYIKGGTDLHFTVAVDFTASNGHQTSPNSLHFLHPTQPNAYADAIRAVGDVVQDYDSDKMFPALGFGARLPPHGVISHEFFLNGHPSDPYCRGIEGVLDAYRNTLSSVRLYGPTNFSPVINHVARIAAAHQTGGAAYFILLIITDGIVSDMQDTKNAIAYASTLPMSIIIVGVGIADFQAMEELDGDHVWSGSNRGGPPPRDIVQFVPMRDIFKPNLDWAENKALLAKEVLAEVPDQLVKYMRSKRFAPLGNFAEGNPASHSVS